MIKVLEIFTFHGGYMGGVATMVKAYMDGVDDFATNNCVLTNLNIAPTIHTGKSSIDNFAYIFTQRNAIRKHLKHNLYDVIHIHTSREFLFLKDVLLAKMIHDSYRIPVVMTIHVGAMETVYNRIGWFKKKSINILNQTVAKTIFLSKVMRDDFLSAGLKELNSTVLYNFHNFVPTTNICTTKDGLQLLYVGAIHKEKGILELLHAIEKSPKLNLHLNICGKITDNTIKDEVDILKKSLSDRVSFLGYVSGEDKTLLYKQSDILILPSYHEGLPLVVMEALGAGCGIIATKVGAIPEILTEKNCLWVDIASDESIIRKLDAITPERLIAMKNANKVLGMQFSFYEHVTQLSNIYKSLVHENSRS